MDQNIFIDYRVTMPVKLLHGTVWNDVRWYGTICGTLTRGQWPNRRAASESMEVKSGLRFEMSDLNYLHIHVHIAYIAHFGGSEATTASKQPRRSNLTSDLKSVTPITYLSMCILLIWYEPFLAASEATTASKQPQRSDLTSDLKSVTSFTYACMVT